MVATRWSTLDHVDSMGCCHQGLHDRSIASRRATLPRYARDEMIRVGSLGDAPSGQCILAIGIPSYASRANDWTLTGDRRQIRSLQRSC